uniref:Uncharacterized protein n=1 Tax=Anopheles dirus TaxID=7168 RepID=A0A182N644_9DIPT
MSVFAAAATGNHSGSNQQHEPRLASDEQSHRFGTISKGFATNENTKRATIVIYPTVSPETVIIPIVSCIIGFPILALLVICCLRRRAKLARDRDRRRNIDLQDHAVSLVRINAIHRFIPYRSMDDRNQTAASNVVHTSIPKPIQLPRPMLYCKELER